MSVTVSKKNSVKLTSPEPTKSDQAPVPKTSGGTAVQPMATVESTYKDGSSVSENELVGDPVLVSGVPATVGLTMAVTRNLGKYESIKMMVSLSVPCENSPTAIEETFDAVKEWVDAKVAKLNNEVDEHLQESAEE